MHVALSGLNMQMINLFMQYFIVAGYQSNLKVLYSSTKAPASAKKTTRHIPQIPERILDAPDILDDYCELKPTSHHVASSQSLYIHTNSSSLSNFRSSAKLFWGHSNLDLSLLRSK